MGLRLRAGGVLRNEVEKGTMRGGVSHRCCWKTLPAKILGRVLGEFSDARNPGATGGYKRTYRSLSANLS